MKKRSFLTIAVAALLGLVGCNNPSPAPDPGPGPEPEPEVEPSRLFVQLSASLLFGEEVPLEEVEAVEKTQFYELPGYEFFSALFTPKEAESLESAESFYEYLFVDDVDEKGDSIYSVAGYLQSVLGEYMMEDVEPTYSEAHGQYNSQCYGSYDIILDDEESGEVLGLSHLGFFAVDVELSADDFDSQEEYEQYASMYKTTEAGALQSVFIFIDGYDDLYDEAGLIANTLTMAYMDEFATSAVAVGGTEQDDFQLLTLFVEPNEGETFNGYSNAGVFGTPAESELPAGSISAETIYNSMFVPAEGQETSELAALLEELGFFAVMKPSYDAEKGYALAVYMLPLEKDGVEGSVYLVIYIEDQTVTYADFLARYQAYIDAGKLTEDVVRAFWEQNYGIYKEDESGAISLALVVIESCWVADPAEEEPANGGEQA